MLIGAEKLTQLLASSLEYWNNAVMRAELLQREALILLDQLKMWFRHLRTNSATSLMAGSRPGSELPSSTLAAGSWLGPGHVLVLVPSSLAAGSRAGAEILSSVSAGSGAGEEMLSPLCAVFFWQSSSSVTILSPSSAISVAARFSGGAAASRSTSPSCRLAGREASEAGDTRERIQGKISEL